MRPELRTVPEDLWVRVASRRADTEGRAIRFESGRVSGRPAKHAVQNLLAGLAPRATCAAEASLRQSVTQGRAVLQRVLQGRITFTPQVRATSFRPYTL